MVVLTNSSELVKGRPEPHCGSTNAQDTAKVFYFAPLVSLCADPTLEILEEINNGALSHLSKKGGTSK